MGITVDMSDADVMDKLSEQALGKGMTAAVSQVAFELNDNGTGVVPKDLGNLRDHSTPGDTGVEYNEPYARAQFNGGYTNVNGTKVEFHHYTEPGTGPHWDEAVQKNDQKMARIKQAYLKGLGL